MKQRIVTGLGLSAFLAVNLWAPNWCMALATLICICFAVWEEYHALVTAGHQVVSWPTWVIMATSVPLTILWPDFTVHDYDNALEAFAHRDRRFGRRIDDRQ